MEITRDFSMEKATTGAVRFKEIPVRGQAPVLRAIYLERWMFESLGDPEKVAITIAVADKEEKQK